MEIDSPIGKLLFPLEGFAVHIYLTLISLTPQILNLHCIVRERACLTFRSKLANH
jgi:hypothetical protein